MYLLVKKDEAGQNGWSKRIRVKFANKPTFLTEMAILYRINPNIVPNPSPNFNRQFFELVQKSDDENKNKYFFSREMAKP